VHEAGAGAAASHRFATSTFHSSLVVIARPVPSSPTSGHRTLEPPGSHSPETRRPGPGCCTIYAARCRIRQVNCPAEFGKQFGNHCVFNRFRSHRIAVEYKRASTTSGRSNSKRWSASLRVDANDVDKVYQGSLMFRPCSRSCSVRLCRCRVGGSWINSRSRSTGIGRYEKSCQRARGALVRGLRTLTARSSQTPT
jgi:hypothetical protein